MPTEGEQLENTITNALAMVGDQLAHLDGIRPHGHTLHEFSTLQFQLDKIAEDPQKLAQLPNELRLQLTDARRLIQRILTHPRAPDRPLSEVAAEMNRQRRPASLAVPPNKPIAASAIKTRIRQFFGRR